MGGSLGLSGLMRFMRVIYRVIYNEWRIIGIVNDRCLVSPAMGAGRQSSAKATWRAASSSNVRRRPKSHWLGIVFGLIFLLGGSAMVIQGLVNDGRTTGGELPARTPPWLRVVYKLIGLSIVVSLAVIASWVAFGPGERRFSSNIPFLGESFGRVAFSIGAALIWLVLIGLGLDTARRLLVGRGAGDRKGSS
jgi:hypothetical protein